MKHAGKQPMAGASCDFDLERAFLATPHAGADSSVWGDRLRVLSPCRLIWGDGREKVRFRLANATEPVEMLHPSYSHVLRQL